LFGYPQAIKFAVARQPDARLRAIRAHLFRTNSAIEETAGTAVFLVLQGVCGGAMFHIWADFCVVTISIATKWRRYNMNCMLQFMLICGGTGRIFVASDVRAGFSRELIIDLEKR
jgi:hypothetical protein